MKKSVLDWIALVLVIIGGLNWGLVGIGALMSAQLNLVSLILGTIPMLENIVYILVGLAAIYTIYIAVKK
jgi:uncharacterized membrane protein YuzA (DUF378 family)